MQLFTIFPTLDPTATVRCSSDGTLGWSGDYFISSSDQSPCERFDFGGDPFAANFYVAYRACIPCDANCDGTINAFDIQPFVEVLAGAVGCSDCAADANVDGSVNALDINAFIDCLSTPLEMR